MYLNCSTQGDFKKQYPDAKIVAVKEAIDKKAKEGLEYHGGMCASTKTAVVHASSTWNQLGVQTAPIPNMALKRR